MSPKWGLDTKTYRLTDRQLQCDFDFDFELRRVQDVHLQVRYKNCSYCHVFWGVRDLETGFGLMTGFVVQLYNLSLHFTNHYMTHYVFSSLSSSTSVSRDSPNSSPYTASGWPKQKTSFPDNSSTIITSPLHRNSSSSIVSCVLISAGTCLQNRCLAMNVYSGSAILDFRRHVTLR
jgi:hypothetical protein